MIAGTFGLCTDREQALWARMSVFSESFDLFAVEAVCGGPPLEKTDLLDTIASLVDQSVVVVDDTPGDSRYRLLRLTREYGSSKLLDADETHARHRDHFDELMADYVGRWSGPGELGLLSNLRADYANITDAIELGLGRAETAQASARMAADLWGFWFSTGRLTEGRSILDHVIESPFLSTPSIERIRALYSNAYLSLLQDDAACARELHSAASALDDGLGNDALNRGLRLELGMMIGLALEEDLDPTGDMAVAMSIFEQADDPRAPTMFMDAVSISVLFAALSGRSDYAQKLGSRGLAVSKRRRDVIWRAYIEYSLGVDAWVQQSFHAAQKRALFGLSTSPDQLLVTHCIELLAWCASSQANFALAARLFGAADRRWDQVGGQFSGFTGLSRVRDECLTLVRRSQNSEEFSAEYRTGHRMTVDDVAAIGTEAYYKTDAIHHQDEPSPLTNREEEVARLIAEGLSNREIARTLTISPRTAESHVDHILTKLSVSSRTQIAAWVLGRRSAETTRKLSTPRSG
ncbi:LuxR C-terminal-related transcriptional regulator [Rhodococcus sp. NPDC078407]|uniref:LuxR C-terminal-related transcriptional regulator n=1 Tax=Rhodococcus sp. NPDC078407 TaxID=3364509 RepID=UPI0037C5B90A